jgi:hypothetical protein
MMGYLHGKRFGSKIAWSNRNEGDSLGVGPAPNFEEEQPVFHLNNITHLLFLF